MPRAHQMNKVLSAYTTTLLLLSTALIFVHCSPAIGLDNLLEADPSIDACILPSVDELKVLQIEIQGSFEEFHQEGEEIHNLENTPATFNYREQASMHDDKILLDWQQEFIYPFPYSGRSTILVSGQQGYIEGVHSFGSRFFGQTAKTPLQSARVASILKSQQLANPLYVLQKGEKSWKAFDAAPIVKTHFDSATGLLSAVETMEADPLLGDTSLRIEFLEWKSYPLGNSCSKIQFPSKRIFMLGDNIIRREQVLSIAIPMDTSALAENVNFEGFPNENELKIGYLASQWYQRMFSFGFSQDMPMNVVNINPLMVNNTPTDVHLITGQPELAYMTLAVETPNGLIYVEPVINQIRSKAVLDALSSTFPNQSIESLITTHMHVDHLGGIATLAATSQKVYVGANGVNAAIDAIERPRTIFPVTNPNPSTPKVLGVSQVTSFKTKNGTIELHPIKTIHVDDMLLIYFPHIKTIYAGDIYNAGFGAGWPFYTVGTRTILQERAQLVLNYIENNSLDVQTMLGVHGGVSTIEDLKAQATLPIDDL